MKKFLALLCTIAMVISLFTGIVIAAPTDNGGTATVKFDSGLYRASVDTETTLKLTYTPGAGVTSPTTASVKFNFTADYDAATQPNINAMDLKVVGAGITPAGWTAVIDPVSNSIVYTGTILSGNNVVFKPAVHTPATAGAIRSITVNDKYGVGNYGAAAQTVTMASAAATQLSAAYDLSLNLSTITVGKSASISGIVSKGGKTPAATDSIYWLVVGPNAAGNGYEAIDKGQVIGGMLVTSTAVSFDREGNYRVVLSDTAFTQTAGDAYAYANETSTFGAATVAAKYTFTLDNPGTVNFDEAKIITGKVQKWDNATNALVGVSAPVYSWYDQDGTITKGASLVTSGSDGSFAAIVKYSDVADYSIGTANFSYASVVSLSQQAAVLTTPDQITYVPGADNPIDLKLTLGKDTDGSDKVSATGTTRITLTGVKIKDQGDPAGYTVDRANSTWTTGSEPYFTKLVLTATGTPDNTLTIRALEQGTLTVKAEFQPATYVGKYDYVATNTIAVGAAAKFNTNVAITGALDSDNNLVPGTSYSFGVTAYDNNNLAADGIPAVGAPANNPLNKIVVKVSGPGYEETKFEGSARTINATAVTFTAAGTATVTIQGVYDNGNLTDLVTKTYTVAGYTVTLDSNQGYVNADNATTIKATVVDTNGNPVNNAKVELATKNGASSFILKNSNGAYPTDSKTNTVAVDGIRTTVTNGVYEFSVKLLSAADVTVNVYKFNTTTLAWAATPTAKADYTIYGSQVYTVTAVQPTVIAGMQETMALKVTDANGNPVTSGVTFSAKPVTTDNGEAISDLATLGYSVEDNTFKIPNVVANLPGQYTITASTDNGNKAGQVTVTAVTAKLQLNYSDKNVTENFKDHFTVTVLDPRNDQPLNAKLFVGSTMPYINDAKATAATTDVKLYPADGNGKFDTQEVTGYLGATTKASSYDFEVLTTNLKTKNTSTDTELAPQIRIRQVGVNPDGSERLNTLVTLDVKAASFKVNPEAIYANSLNNVTLTYVDAHNNPLVDYKVNVPGVLTDALTDDNGQVAFSILPNATSSVKMTGQTDNAAVNVEQNLNFSLDTEKPVLTVNAPATVKASTLTISGTVTDNVKVDKVYVNGTQAIVFDGSFEADVALKLGANTIKVYAFDASGNGVQQVVTVNYVLPTVVKLAVNSKDATIGGAAAALDVAPYVKAGRTMVPLRFIGEALGAAIDWNEATQTVTYTLGDSQVVVTIGSTTAMVNGVVKTLDVAPEITNNRTMVPVRFISEALGATVNFDAATNSITIIQ